LKACPFKRALKKLLSVGSDWIPGGLYTIGIFKSTIDEKKRGRKKNEIRVSRDFRVQLNEKL